MSSSVANDFRVRTKGGKQQHYKELKQIRYFNIINTAECWCEIGCTSEDSVIHQSWSTRFPMATFSQLALFGSWTTCPWDVWKGRWYVNANVFVSSMFNNSQFHFKYYFLRHRNSPSKRLLSIYSQFWFTKILKALQILIFTAFWRNVPRPS